MTLTEDPLIDPVQRTAAAMLRSVGLRPDGPVLWGRPLTTRAPGLYLVELPETRNSPGIDINRVGKWLEHVPDLRMDRERPTSKALATRLNSLWLPTETVLYIGATKNSLGGRVNSLAHHVIGDRKPHADGHWLHLIAGMDKARLWFAETDATEEYLDALLDAFAAGLDTSTIPARPAGALPLPWGNLRRPTGERQAHGLTNSILPDDTVPAKPTRITNLPAGDADGARPDARGTGTTRRSPGVNPATGRPLSPKPRAARSPIARVVPVSARAVPLPMSAEAIERLDTELDELTRVRRTEIVARIKSARELGDLKENAEYQSAREEQSFLEGRIRMLEERRRNAVVIQEAVTGKAGIGSTVVLEQDGEEIVYTLVGSTESDPAKGRISVASPVGAALVGAVAGADVSVRTPRGASRYRVVEVR
ncbi:MAG: transcription elongation factor GreA [Candidatus Limnocylindrales bacterium]